MLIATVFEVKLKCNEGGRQGQASMDHLSCCNSGIHQCRLKQRAAVVLLMQGESEVIALLTYSRWRKITMLAAVQEARSSKCNKPLLQQ